MSEPLTKVLEGVQTHFQRYENPTKKQEDTLRRNLPEFKEKSHDKESTWFRHERTRKRLKYVETELGIPAKYFLMLAIPPTRVAAEDMKLFCDWWKERDIPENFHKWFKRTQASDQSGAFVRHVSSSTLIGVADQQLVPDIETSDGSGYAITSEDRIIKAVKASKGAMLTMPRPEGANPFLTITCTESTALYLLGQIEQTEE
ncbi:uncharacterized protein F5Z01DRAFT_665480 [Emericellopsis atlantica]|uniref:Uncharacterized protein n=1 Tax=Emericellopsis atlantica TaxID=2614577 RepID=A0A9P7ZF25_9HYPO|nr:uncharacterized protein F5Z01DRAFT_665480 [Emericellopsis atlantica]KAG9250642.1 hypothetical protein F5Z01DRAFT_665480 [Emericellopsis atlantica]